MDMGTIAKKLKDGKYDGLEDFRSDWMLMLNNCFFYNPADSWIVDEANKLKVRQRQADLI